MMNGYYDWEVDPVHMALVDLTVVNGDLTWDSVLNVLPSNGGIGIGQA
jgi:hypothetical protein